jgi:hypothetical protein
MIKWTIFVLLFLVLNQGCGVKGKPMPPLQQPFISSGNYQEDAQKKQKDKKKSQSTAPMQEQETNPNENE